MKRILVCEDEDVIRDFVVINLKRAGYDVCDVGCGEDALRVFEEEHGNFDIVLLDIMMPGIDGFTVCKKLREKSSTIGIIMLTARTQEMDKVSGLMFGADDYITKPFSPSELTARVDAIYRRVCMSFIKDEQSPVIESGPFTLNLKSLTVTKNGKLIDLTQVEYQIMEYFLNNQNTALDRASILNHIWGDGYFGDDTGFAKTRLLKPGETQTLTVEIPQKQLASFNEETHTWIVEKGKYGILVGNSSDKLKLEAVLVVSDDTVLEQMDKICPLQEELEQIYLTKELKEKSVQRQEKLITAQVPEYYFKPAMIPAKSEDAGKNQENLTEEEKRFVSVLEDRTTEELIPLLYGKISENISTLGAAGIRVPGSAGETCGTLEEDGIPSLVMADGPAGIRLRQWYEVDKETDSIYEMGVLGSLENGILEPGVHHENADTYYQYCTAFPVGTALAQTWDTDLMTEFGKAIAEEMEEFHVNLWLAPGMNIHRNPLCGRNYEYYSEDPYLSGMLAAAVIRGVQSKSGCGVTIKHFACNNQEDNRMGVDSCVSERALREIYLRGFEIAVKEGNPVSIMTSYNLINGIHAANSKDLCMTVARKEWGFDGAIMSDWNTTVPEDGSVPWKCVAAGNDIIMPGNPDDDKNIRQAYKEGKLTEEEIRNCAGHLVSMIRRLERTDC